MHLTLKHYYLLLSFFLILFCHSQNSDTIGNNSRAGKYFTHSNASVYYEIYGSGPPLLLLHGNGGSIKAKAHLIADFAKKYKVIAMDSRCHGKSSCPTGPLTYEQIAGDANALLTKLKLDSVYVWGHSDGAIVGLLIAINYPGKIKKLLASGGNLRPDTTAVDPEAYSMVEALKKTATDSVQIKLLKLLIEQPNIPVKDLLKIKCDVLVMAGDRDIIRNEHTLEIFNTIPHAFLCILPGTTHFVSEQRRKWFTDIMYDFFDNPLYRLTTVQMMKQRMNGKQ
jgi:pimeloyl-ACP methyl ester carboxylesterase